MTTTSLLYIMKISNYKIPEEKVNYSLMKNHKGFTYTYYYFKYK